jgi:hypothetical protein
MRCASCEGEIRPGQGREVDVDQGTGASPTLTIHDDPNRCAPVVPVRRTPRPLSH